MDTYHIFAIKKEVHKIYINNPFSLYKILYNLYNLNKEDLSYGVTLYNQLCYPINTKKIKRYFELMDNIRKGNNKYLLTHKKQKSLIIIKASHIIYKTQKKKTIDLYILNNYYNYLFICNFTKKEYYWLNEILIKK